VEAGSPVIVAGSTHAGEEKILAAIVSELRGEFPGLFLVVVPRHAERWRDALADMVAAGLRVAVQSEPAQPADALIVNTTGELRDWYDCADVVFVGKSLTAHGGQNPAEPLSAGKAVVFGPNMENFQTLADQLVRDEGARQVADAAELGRALREVLDDPAGREAMAARGAACLDVHRGATHRTCDVLGFP
jgi:3-deoxy-D-manno-octulosonic-acid transferase